MSPNIAGRRGQPLTVLVLLIAAWVVARLVVWESPLARSRSGSVDREAQLVRGMVPVSGTRSLARQTGGPVIATASRTEGAHVPAEPSESAWTPPAAPPMLALRRSTRAQLAKPAAGAMPQVQPPLQPSPLFGPDPAGGDRPTRMARLGPPPLPPRKGSSPQPFAGAEPLPTGQPEQRPATSLLALARSRWSGDSWLLWRDGSGGFAAAGRAGYGGSQAGAVLRYSLAPGSGHAPAVHARHSRALAFSEGEVAAGVSARPLAGVPLRLLGEARVQRSGESVRLRPAATVITELPLQPLPAGFVLEAYGQAGYVGGRGATAFFDGQATAQRRASAAGPVELHLGGGAWAGGQEGASRLDIGPRATLHLNLPGGGSRVTLDWRFRVAGGASPSSGPALTVSAGF